MQVLFNIRHKISVRKHRHPIIGKLLRKLTPRYVIVQFPQTFFLSPNKVRTSRGHIAKKRTQSFIFTFPFAGIISFRTNQLGSIWPAWRFFPRISNYTYLISISGGHRHHSCLQMGSFSVSMFLHIESGMCRCEFLLSRVDLSVRTAQTNKQDPISRWIAIDSKCREKFISVNISRRGSGTFRMFAVVSSLTDLYHLSNEIFNQNVTLSVPG